MELEGLVHVSHRKWFSLALGVFLLGSAIFFTYTVLISTPLAVLEVLSAAAVVFDLLLATMFVAGFYLVRSFVKSRRIEFFEKFVKIYGFWGKNSRQFPYSDMDIGRLRMRNVRGAISFHFNISVRNERGRSWDIGNAKLKTGIDSSLYAWLSERIQ